MVSDYRDLGLTPRELALATYAAVLTRAPGDMRSTAVTQLREHGLTDADILKTNMVVSYFNFVNRIAQGLGVEFSDEEVAGYRY